MSNYQKVNWQNSPSTQTPLNSDNLNHMDNGIEQNSEDISELKIVKADKTDVEENTADIKKLDTSKLDNTDSVIKSNHIENYAITTLKIADGAISGKKLEAGAVTRYKLDSTIYNAICDNTDNVKDLQTNKADKTDVYTKSETEEKFAQIDNVYNCEEADGHFIPQKNKDGGGVVTDYIANGAVTLAKLNTDVIDTCSGNLIPDTSISENVSSATYECEKVGNYAILTVNIVMNTKILKGTTMKFSGLPYANKTLTAVLSSTYSAVSLGTMFKLLLKSTSTDLYVSLYDDLTASTRMSAVITYKIS